MGIYSQQGCELIASIEVMTTEIVTDVLSRASIPTAARENMAKTAAKRLADELATFWGGQQVYIPMDLVRRNKAIYDAFTGDNQHELARKFRMSTNHIYQIIKCERDRRRHQQAKLPI